MSCVYKFLNSFEYLICRFWLSSYCHRLYVHSSCITTTTMTTITLHWAQSSVTLNNRGALEANTKAWLFRLIGCLPCHLHTNRVASNLVTTATIATDSHSCCFSSLFEYRWVGFDHSFSPRDATLSAVLLRQVVRTSVCILCSSVRDLEVSWSHRLEYCENNFMAD